MKALSLILLFSMPVCFNQFVNAEMNESHFKNSAALIQRANELNDSGYYQSAIALLKNVADTDPNYIWSTYELALNYFNLEDYPESYRLCKKAEFLRYDNPLLYSLLGSCLDHLGKPYEGVTVINQALKKWPYNQNLIYNLGVCWLNAGMPDSAEQVIQKAIILYPYHTRSHMLLARANYAMGRIAESYLAFSMAILISPNLSNIKEFEKALSGEINITPRLYQYPYPDGYKHGKWDNLRYLLQSEIAFNKAFDYPFELDYTFTRQSYLLFGNLNYDLSDTSAYSRLYARLFSEMISYGYFETYVNYCMKNLGNENSNNWDKNNPGKISSFVQWAQTFLDKGRMYAFNETLRLKDIRIHHYDDNGKLTTIGEQSGKEDIRNGDFIVVSDDGAVSEKGKYTNGLAEGEWLAFWPDGKIKQHLEFINDKMDGAITIYYPDGSKSWIYSFTKGMKNGVSEHYTASGNLLEKNIYENDKMNGPGIVYNYEEGFSRTYQYRLDTLTGTTVEKWLHGSPKAEYETKDNDYQGKYKSWYANGNPESKCYYTNNLKTGPWVNYHYNGAVRDSGFYDTEGRLSGQLKSFDNDGKLISLEKEYKEGLLTGSAISYFENGREQVIQYYRQDTLVKIESFNNKGELLYTKEASGDSLYYKSFYGDGILMKEGLMVAGKYEGQWISYNPLGIKISDYNYMNNMFSGAQKTYFANSALREEYECDSNNITGIYKSYFINGHLQSVGNYESGATNGEWITYYRNDSIHSKAFYINGKRAGRNILYNPDGAIASEEFYNNEGQAVRNIGYDQYQKIESDWVYDFGTFQFTTHYPDGRIKSVVNISDNNRHGLQQEFFPNGQLANEINYLYGKPHGQVLCYDHHGNPESSGNYLMGNRDGEYKVFNQKVPDYDAYYENGVCDGKARDYYTNGALAREMSIHNDERSGMCDYFAPDGSFMYRLRFENDVIKGYTWKNSSGSFVHEVKITDNTNRILTYYPNGKISAKISISKGIYHGKFLTYYPTGTALQESEMIHGEDSGVRKEFYPDGVLRSITTYLNDEKNGPCTTYYQHGAIKESGEYFSNSKNGVWNKFNEKSEITEKLFYYQDILYEIIKN